VEQAKNNADLAKWQAKEQGYIQKIELLEQKIKNLEQHSYTRSKNEKYTRNMSRRG